MVHTPTSANGEGNGDGNGTPTGKSKSPSASASASASKQAACLACRKSKMKCHRDDSSASPLLGPGAASVCTRCRRNGTDCVVPAFHVGRHKGVKNKRSGLEKALWQVEEALRKERGRAGEGGEVGVVDLQGLLKKTKRGGLGSGDGEEDGAALEGNLYANARRNTDDGQIRQRGSVHARTSNVRQDAERSGASSDLMTTLHTRSPYSSTGQFARADETATHLHTQSLRHNAETSDLADAENPLQLLAQTSEMLLAPTQSGQTPGGDSMLDHHQPGESPSTTRSEYFHQFFGRFRPRLDVGADLDPIELGLITLPESETLFEFFFQNLAHTRWGIDPLIHTTSLVRGRSAFLFTSICAASALFLPSAAAISKRLWIHCRKLAHNVITKRHRSVEIVLAFMVNIPWMSPGDHWADDETCAYLSEALTIAMDLSLHKIVRSAQQPFHNRRDDIPSADCIIPRKALQLDGFDEVEPSSAWGRRLLRRRERAWLALFVLERGVCLARGRNYTLPMTPLVETCDKWHLSDIADVWDGSIVSVAVLRRELAGLMVRVRFSCDNHQLSRLSGSEVTQSIKAEIEGFFERWYSTWPFQIGDRNEFRLPPYVEILASHTRLSLYSSLINYPTAAPEVKHYFRAAGLASALNVMRAAVQGESQLKSMPNNTAIMISFAACFALELSAMVDENRASLAPSVRNLITETADVLERIGATPAHRKGASALYAKQLRSITQRSSMPGRVLSHANETANLQMTTESYPQVHQEQHLTSAYQNGPTHNPGSFVSAEPVTFSGMSNDEIVEAINNAGVGLEMSWADFQFGDGANLDWLDWPT